MFLPEVKNGYVGELLSCLKGVKDPFEVQEKWGNFSDALKAASSRVGGESPEFFSVAAENLGSFRVMMGTSVSRWCGLRIVSLHAGAALRIPLQLLLGQKVLMCSLHRTSGFLSVCMESRVPLGLHNGLGGPHLLETSAFLSSCKKQCQDSCRVDIGMALLYVPQHCHTCHLMF